VIDVSDSIALEDDVLTQFQQLSTAAVSDALDSLRIPGAALGIAPLSEGGTVVGRAFTVAYRPAGREPGTVGDFIDDVPPGGVVVIDNAGRLDCTVWGGIMTTLAAQRGIAATVINGVCRDVRVARDAGYPMFTAGRFMRTGKDRVELASIGEPVSLGGVKVAAGDLVIGDSDGVVVVPRAHEQDVLAQAIAVNDKEEAIVAHIIGGSSLREARSRYGYHTLQRGR
jgi:regulator of RNase E activity RraA